MIATIDLTEDGGYAGEGGCPDPSTICTEGDEVVVAFREVNIRFQLSQFLDFLEAANLWAWRGRDDEVEVGDPEYVPAAELERIRGLLRKTLDVGVIGDEYGGGLRVEVPEDVRRALRWELATARVDPENWRFLRSELDGARAEIAQLKAKLARRETGLAAAKTKAKAARPAKET